MLPTTEATLTIAPPAHIAHMQAEGHLGDRFATIWMVVAEILRLIAELRPHPPPAPA